MRDYVEDKEMWRGHVLFKLVKLVYNCEYNYIFINILNSCLATIILIYIFVFKDFDTSF